jgi:Domain of Unknown Function (DUF1080)
MIRTAAAFVACCLAAGLTAVPAADGGGWIDLFAGTDLGAWRGPTAGWQVVKAVALDPANPKKLTTEPGEGVLYATGKGKDLLTKRSFADVEVHAEFAVPKGSNSGVKLMGLYEIQIRDTYGIPVQKLTGDSCGGIYPRAEEKPKYHHIDAGFPPRVNAARPAGEWQSLDVTFTAPRFDAAGKKTANAVFKKVVLNGKLIHENRDVGTPTGHAYVKPEVPAGPLLLQGDHGPVAFRDVRVRELGR